MKRRLCNGQKLHGEGGKGEVCVAFVLFLLERGNFSFTLAYEKVSSSSSFKDGEELSFFLGSGENAFLAPPFPPIQGGEGLFISATVHGYTGFFSKTVSLTLERP